MSEIPEATLSNNRFRKYSPRKEFLAGARDMVPLVVGAIPFGIIFGTLARSSGLSWGGAMAMSVFVFAGSAQFIVLGLLAAGTALPVIILTTFVVNLRHLLYAVSLVPHFKHLAPGWKAILAFWLTDESFAVGINRYNRSNWAETNAASGDRPYKHWYYFGAALFMYANWQLCTLAGLIFGQLIPDVANWGLDFAMSVTFIGIIIPYIRNQPMLVTVLVAGVVSLLAYHLPHQLGLIVAAGAGIAAGSAMQVTAPK